MGSRPSRLTVGFAPEYKVTVLGIEIEEEGHRSKEAEHEREEGVRDEDSLI